jgi:BASS family bile acid:Na+ symporter
MDVAQIAGLAVSFSIFLVVLSLGLRTSLSDAMFLFRHPQLLLRSIIAMNVAMPLIVAAIASLFALHPPVKVALIAFALSPMPPFLPGKELKLVTSGHEAYVYGLLVATSLLAIVIIPLTVALLAAAFGRAVSIAPQTVARIVAISVLLPLAAGIALRHWLPAAERWSSTVNTVGMALLAFVLVLLIVRMWPAMIGLVGDGTLLAIVAVTLISIGVGHLLGGPDEDDRTVLALATGSRHPAVALAVAGLAGEALAPAAVLLALIVSALAAVPYTAWRRRRRDVASLPPEKAGFR